MNPLLSANSIDEPPESFLRSVAEVFAVFDEKTQDSGNISYGVRTGEDRYFAKTAGIPDDDRPYLRYSGRVALLRNAVRLHDAFRHHALVPLRHVIESPGGPMLIYPWVEGELLGKPLGTGRGRPILERFRELPPGEILNALGIIFEVHTGLAAAGWMAVDFYDGCLIYDFDAQRLGLIDLDCYHPGPFTNEMGRMFGSSRFMAPEEFERGARIDEQTTVFTMGRTAFVLLANGSTDPEDFRGGGRIFEVVRRACRDERGERQASMAEFYSAWSNAKA